MARMDELHIAHGFGLRDLDQMTHAAAIADRTMALGYDDKKDIAWSAIAEALVTAQAACVAGVSGMRTRPERQALRTGKGFLMASDDLTAAAERALIEQACNHAFMKTTHRGDWIADEQAVARAAIEFYRRNAAPAPAVDPDEIEKRASRMAANAGLNWTGNSFLASKPAWRIEAEKAIKAERAVPVPADRERLIEAVAANHLRRYESQYQADHLTWRDFATDAAEDVDALLARGLRLPAKSASQVELAARLRDMSYRGVQMTQFEAMVYAAYVLSAFDVRVPAEEGDEDVTRG